MGTAFIEHCRAAVSAKGCQQWAPRGQAVLPRAHCRTQPRSLTAGREHGAGPAASLRCTDGFKEVRPRCRATHVPANPVWHYFPFFQPEQSSKRSNFLKLLSKSWVLPSHSGASPALCCRKPHRRPASTAALVPNSWMSGSQALAAPRRRPHPRREPRRVARNDPWLPQPRGLGRCPSPKGPG